MPITRCIKFLSEIYLVANLEKADVFQQEVSVINSKTNLLLKFHIKGDLPEQKGLT